MKYFLILCFVFEGLLAKPLQKNIVIPKYEYYLTSHEKVRYTIFKFNSKELAYHHHIGFEKNDVPARLSDMEIKQIEKIIDKKVELFNKENMRAGRDRWNIKSPEKYFKQIVAVLNKKGEKEVWVNCLCEVQKDKWKKEIPIIEDGGQCYFELKINLTTAVVTNFGTNGVA